ncbi:MAG: hypothetical protein Q4A76_05285, partial [Porphyromonadaceae bacterium]|nr:hypothetical protein [Porphyromonadaceae bacterium]
MTIAVTPALSQQEYPGIPQSFSIGEQSLRSLENIKVIDFIPTLNVDDIKSEQTWNNSNIQTKPLKVGILIPQKVDFSQEAETVLLNNGKTIYRLKIAGEEAKGMILYYDEFEIPAGGKLYLYNEDKSIVHGAYTEKTNPTRGKFATSPIMADHIIMEYEPGSNNQLPKIVISDLGYLFSQTTPKFRAESGEEIITGEDTSMPNCQINANCPEASDWRKQMAGVCQIYLTLIENDRKFISACSGTLINNTKEDYAPLIISAAHCTGENMSEDNFNEYFDQWIFNFHYMKPGCSNSPSGYGRQVKSMVGCDIVSYLPFQNHSDGILLKLKEEIPASYRVYYNGWDRRDRLYEKAIGLHHPAGDAMKISFHDGQPELSKANFGYPNIGKEDAHFKFHFTKGDTEGGSSGSGLFNENGLLVGTLTGGGPGVCLYLSKDYYGRLTAHWDWFKGEKGLTFKGKDMSSMADYLDPDNTKKEFLEGRFRDNMYPLSPSERLDASIMENGGSILLSWKSPYGSKEFEYKGIKYYIYRDGEQIATVEDQLQYKDDVTTNFYGNNKVDYAVRVAYPSTNDNGETEYTLSAAQNASIYVGKLSLNTEAKKEQTDEGVKVSWRVPVINQLVSKVNPDNKYELEEMTVKPIRAQGFSEPEPLQFREKWPIQSPLYDSINEIQAEDLYIKQINFVPAAKATSIYVLAMLNDNLKKKMLQKVTIPNDHPEKTWMRVALEKPFKIDKNQMLYIGFGTENKMFTSSICKYKGSDEIKFEYYKPYVEGYIGDYSEGFFTPPISFWADFSILEAFGYKKEQDLMAINYIVSNDPTPLAKEIDIEETVYTGAFPINAPKPIGYKIS